VEIEFPFKINNPLMFADGKTASEFSIQNLSGDISSVSVEMKPEGGFVMAGNKNN
jgi:hypothetical protein